MQVKEELIKYRIERAKQTIFEAQMAIERNMLHLAANRIYYSIFYFVSALAIKNDFSTSKHSQLRGWFNKNFIKTNLIPTMFSDIYNKAYETRQEGDYEDMVEFSKEDILNKYNDMLKFVNHVEEFIKGKQNENQ